MRRTAGAVVVGAGVIGASTAYHLAAKGVDDVLLLDKAGPAAGATGNAVALVRFNYPDYASAALAFHSYRTFREWGDVIGGESGFTSCGLLALAGPQHADSLRSTVEMIRAEVSDEISFISSEDVKLLQPFMVTDDLGGASYQPHAGYAIGSDTVTSLIARSRELGVRAGLDSRVTSIRVRGDSVVGVSTERGDVDSPIVVLCAGSWTAPLAETAGVSVPVRPGMLSAGLLRRPPEVPRHMAILDGVGGGYWRPDIGEHTAIGISFPRVDRHWPDDPDRPDVRITEEEMAESAAVVAGRVPAMAEAGWVRTWAGVDGFTPDGRMVLDRAPGVDGLYIAAGGSGHGFKTGPAVGLCMAEWIVDGEPGTVDLHDFRLERFPSGDPWGHGWHPNELLRESGSKTVDRWR